MHYRIKLTEDSDKLAFLLTNHLGRTVTYKNILLLGLLRNDFESTYGIDMVDAPNAFSLFVLQHPMLENLE